MFHDLLVGGKADAAVSFCVTHAGVAVPVNSSVFCDDVACGSDHFGECVNKTDGVAGCQYHRDARIHQATDLFHGVHGEAPPVIGECSVYVGDEGFRHENILGLAGFSVCAEDASGIFSAGYSGVLFWRGMPMWRHGFSSVCELDLCGRPNIGSAALLWMNERK